MTPIDVLEMHVAEKLTPMEALWDSLCALPETSMPFSAWHGEVLAERLHRLACGDETSAPWQEAKERIRATIKATVITVLDCRQNPASITERLKQCRALPPFGAKMATVIH